MNDSHAHPNHVSSSSSRLATQPIVLVDGGVHAIPTVVRGDAAAEGSVEAFILSKIDGIRSIAELAVLAALAPQEALHVIAGLVIQGAVEIASTPPLRESTRIRRADPRVEPQTEIDQFVDFADVFEELEREDAALRGERID